MKKMPFEEKYLVLVIKPQLVAALTELNTSKTEVTRQSLLEAMVSRAGVPIASAQFDRWIRELGINFKRVTLVEGLDPPPAPPPSEDWDSSPEARIVHSPGAPHLVKDPDNAPPPTNRDMFGELS